MTSGRPTLAASHAGTGRRASWWAHAGALAVVLAVLVPVLGGGSVTSADEGAVLAQLEVLDATGSWAMPNPMPDVDPDGRWFGLEKSETDGESFFPYAKHAVYPWVLRPLYGWGGPLLVVGASAFGTWVAAVLAGLLARRVDRRAGTRLDVATLWVVGVTSPLFFDSFWAVAHSIGAAFATGAILAALHVVEARRWRGTVGVVAGVVGAAWFRSEGVLYGVALGCAAGLVAVAPALSTLRSRSSVRESWRAVDRAGVGVAVAAGVAAVGAWWADARISSSIIGTAVAPFRVANRDESWVAGRVQGVWATLLRPQLQAPTLAGGLFVVATILGLLAAGYARRRPSETVVIRGAAVGAACCALVAAALPKAPVPGLVVAFPLLPLGLVSMRRSILGTRAARLSLATFVVYAAAVAATQYSIGGSMEWGGRYFHLALPALVPVLLVALSSTARRLDVGTVRVAGASLGVVSAVLVLFAGGTVVRLHGMTRPVVTEIVRLADATSGASDAAGPVVVTDMVATGRLAWDHTVRSRYLTVPEERDLPAVAARLADAGVDEFVFASAYHHDRHVARLRPYEPVAGRTVDVGDWRLFVLRRS